MKIFETAVKTFAFIFENEFQKTTEAQINNTIETNKFVVKTKMISIIFKKTSTANAVKILNFDHLSISSANAIEAANILQTNQNLNSNFIEISNTSLNFNVTLNFNFDLTSSPQYWTVTKEIQHRKKIKKRFQQQKKIESESESIINTNAIKSFENENMTLYNTFDFFEKRITSTFEIEHN